MLKTLYVKNVAIIPELEIELSDGLNILSGETGAGKSIIIDSLSFLLGERADKSLIRYGENTAVVQGVFTVSENSACSEILKELGIDYEDEIIIKRSMSVEGKNEIRINGQIANLSMLKSITDVLCDIYGQNEHQSLLKVSSHIQLLDKFAASELDEVKTEYQSTLSSYKNLKKQIENIGDETERARRADILRFQIDEIKRADLHEGEDLEIAELRTKIANTEKICEGLSGASNSISSSSESGNALSIISFAMQNLNSVSRYDGKISEVAERLESSYIELKDIADQIDSIISEYDFNPYQAQEIEDRFDLIKLLKKKYGYEISDILKYLQNAEEELQKIESADNLLEDLTFEFDKVKKKLFDLSSKISKIRKKYAEIFEKTVVSELNDLGMVGSSFAISFNDSLNFDNFENYLRNDGTDSVEFLISPNKGEPLKPLVKIVSGGETSRFMLACKKIIAKLDGIETLVFDEVDSGISGRIAQVVAEKLYNISRFSQVIAVTHLPQLSAMSDNHYLIEKISDESKTYTVVRRLSESEKEIEVARLAGAENNEHSIAHAREIIAYAQNYKKSVE